MATLVVLFAGLLAGATAVSARASVDNGAAMSGNMEQDTTDEERVDVFVRFRSGESEIDSTFMDNSAQLAKIRSVFKKVNDDPFTLVNYIIFAGTASPEGSAEINTRLSRERLESLEKLVRKDLDIAEGDIKRQDMYIPWGMVDSLLETSDIEGKEEARKIISEKSEIVDNPGGGTVDSRILKLKGLNGGRTWKEMNVRNEVIGRVLSEP